MNNRSLSKNQNGSALLEGLIAILIFSMGILALMGLQAISIKQSVDAKYRSDANFLASQIIGQMWIDKNQLGTYISGVNTKKDAWTTRVQSTLPNSSGTIELNGNQVTVTISWQPAGQDVAHRHIAISQINTN